MPVIPFLVGVKKRKRSMATHPSSIRNSRMEGAPRELFDGKAAARDTNSLPAIPSEPPGKGWL